MRTDTASRVIARAASSGAREAPLEKAREGTHPSTLRKRKKNGWPSPLIDAAWAIQGGRCGICGGPLPSKEKACADHDHETRFPFPRALLCDTCNRLEGCLQKLGFPPHLTPPVVAHYVAFYRDLEARAEKDPDGRYLPLWAPNPR